MNSLPVYKLVCDSGAAAELFADLLRKRGFVSAEADHGTLTLSWGGGFKGLSDIYDMGRDLGVAGDVEWSEFLMQAASKEDR